jgi:hypothetical protein
MFTQQEFNFLIEAISDKSNALVTKIITMVQEEQARQELAMQKEQKTKETKKEKSE